MERLLHLVQERMDPSSGGRDDLVNWGEVAQLLGGRTAKQCRWVEHERQPPSSQQKTRQSTYGGGTHTDPSSALLLFSCSCHTGKNSGVFRSDCRLCSRKRRAGALFPGAHPAVCLTIAALLGAWFHPPVGTTCALTLQRLRGPLRRSTSSRSRIASLETSESFHFPCICVTLQSALSRLAIVLHAGGMTLPSSFRGGQRIPSRCVRCETGRSTSA